MGYVSDGIDEFGRAATPLSSRGPRIGLISRAWTIVSLQLGTWVLACLIWFVVLSVVGSAFGLGSPKRVRQGYFLVALFQIDAKNVLRMLALTSLNGFLLGGMFRMANRQLRGERISAGQIFEVSDCLGPLVVEAVLVGLIIDFALCMCLLPGLVACGLLMFALPLVADARLPATSAISLSFDSLKGRWLQASVFHLLAALVGMLGALACGVGIIFTLPIYVMAVTLAYQETFGKAKVAHSFI